MESSEEFKHYQLPEGIAKRVNLGTENPYPPKVKSAEFEKPSGHLTITFYEGTNQLPAEIRVETNHTWLLIADGEGIVTKSETEFPIENVPAIFYLSPSESLKVQGKFSAWIVKLQEETPISESLPTQAGNPISEKVFAHKELEGKIDDSVKDRFPYGEGETIRWAFGQWNSKSPLNIAFEEGGLGSIGDRMHKEPDVLEIHLVNQGRCVLTCLDKDGQIIKFPNRKGDVVAIEPGTFCQMSRYSGHYKGFTLKWSINPGEIIDPKKKIYYEGN